MKRESKNGSSSGKSGRSRGKFASRFCMFPKVKSADTGPGFAPVYLNVYDLTPINGYMYWAGVGIYHTGVEVNGSEYAFGAHDFPTSGVFEVEPRQCPGFKFRKAIFMGTTSLEPSEVRDFMEQQSRNYHGDTYHLIVKNCNHFCDDICHKLTGKKIPKWVNRLARIGSVCNCILPESLKASTIPEPHLEVFENEKKHLRPFSCFSSFSMSQKEESISSLFLHSHYLGCLPSWRHSMNILIDQATAEVVHIDLGVAFEQGLMLKTPERVPFRLTRDIIDGMGVTGVEGVFRRCCEETLAVMRTNKEALLTIIEVFIHDPLYKWALSPLKALQRQKETDEDLETSWEDSQDECEGNKDAARALMRVKQKLDGYEDGEMRSVHGQVQQLIQDAIDPERLCNMFPGWGAWM